MADFPAADPNFTDLDGNQTLAANNHAARHNKVHREIEAIAQRVGTTGDTDPASHEKKIADLQTNKADTSYVNTQDAALSALIASTAAAVKQALYPVGSLYYNATDNTNPGTLLGFGTWVAFGAGKVPVGIDPLDVDFDTAGETGGEKTHTLTINEMPSHNHDIARPPWRTGERTGSSIVWAPSLGPYNLFNDTVAIANKGGGAAHNNLQPYVVVYMWQRTA